VEKHLSVSFNSQKKTEGVTLISPRHVRQNTQSPGGQEGMSLDEKILQGNFRLSQMRKGEPLSRLLDVEEQYKAS